MVLLNGVLLDYPTDMTEAEATTYAKEEIDLWHKKGKTIDRIHIAIEENEVIIHAFEKSPIRRVRRITGYLSDCSNFNDAKRAELADRVIHI
ncbi:MAG: hypothetical protein H6Q74_2093 [Firmicutes bacterium]|nr:hypothetical protein [Bacillota bacterium]